MSVCLSVCQTFQFLFIFASYQSSLDALVYLNFLSEYTLKPWKNNLSQLKDFGLVLTHSLQLL